MTRTAFVPTPQNDEYYGDQLVLTYKKSIRKVLDPDHKDAVEGVSKSLREIDSEPFRVECPLISFINKDTREEVSNDEVNELVQQEFSDIARKEPHEVEYKINGETYIAVYDISDYPDLDEL